MRQFAAARAPAASAPKTLPPRFDILRIEAARMVQEPLNPAVLEAARQLVDRTEPALARRPATGCRDCGP